MSDVVGLEGLMQAEELFMLAVVVQHQIGVEEEATEAVVEAKEVVVEATEAVVEVVAGKEDVEVEDVVQVEDTFLCTCRCADAQTRS